MRHGFCPPNICFDPFTALAVGTTVLSVGGGIMKGSAEKKAASESANNQEAQANILLDESAAEAGRVADDRRDFLRRQTLAYTKSGVELEGSPLLVLENTRSKSQEEVDAIVKSGANQYRTNMANARATRKAGRAALISSYIEGGAKLGTAGIQANQAGLFNATKAPTQSQILGYSTKAYR